MNVYLNATLADVCINGQNGIKNSLVEDKSDGQKESAN